MSSTYSLAKEAASIVGPDGTVFYALFEQTYEANLQSNPQWCALYFGTAQACMGRIIRLAAHCEGGCLKEQGGNVSPSAYIKHWRQAMAQSRKLGCSRVSASFGKGVYSLKPENRNSIAALLAKHGHAGIEEDCVTINVAEQPALLQAILDAGNPAWLFLDRWDVQEGNGVPYEPSQTKASLPDFDVFYIREHSDRDAENWVRLDSQVLHTGWEYSTIEYLINQLVIPGEAKVPGSAESAIRLLRSCVREAIPLSLKQEMRIERPKPEAASYDQRRFDTLTAKLGLSQVSGFVTSVEKVLEAKALYDMKTLPVGLVKFIDLPAAGICQQEELLTA